MTGILFATLLYQIVLIFHPIAKRLILNGFFNRVVSCDYPEKEARAVFNNLISEEDLKILLSPDNCMSFTISDFGTGYTSKVTFSKKPEFNTSTDYTYGKENILPVPFTGGTSIVTRNGNVIVKKVTFPDVVYTYDTIVSSSGVSIKMSSTRDGYISTSVWEKVNASFCGFFVMQNHVDADKYMTANNRMTKANAENLLSYAAVRITEKNGNYEMIDCLGDGSKKSVTFKLGLEFEDEDSFGRTGTHLFTSNSPSELVYTFKEKDTGHVYVFRNTATTDHLTWTAEKAPHGIKCSITYQRYGDIEGTWKVMTHSNYDNFLRGLSLPEPLISAAVEERETLTWKHLGKGIWLDASSSKVLPMESKHLTPGVEHSSEMMGMHVTEIFNHSKDGMYGTVKMGENIINYKVVVGKELAHMEEEIVGKPFTKATIILAKM